MDKSDFLKIIYFDEPFVADFMQIRAGGELKKTTEFISEVATEAEGKGSAEGEFGTNKKGLPQLFGFLSGVNISAKASGEMELSRKKDRIVKNILENTLLADFIALIEADEKRSKNKRCAGISVFQDMTVKPEVNSFAFFMLVAPFFNMIDGMIPLKTNDGQEMNLDIGRIEDAIKAGRGYYEFIASDGTSEKIFRFNQAAFRNNYTMSDLPKMKLTYYAVKVGAIEKDDLRVEKEFEFGTMRVPDRVEYSGSNPKEDHKAIDVYDVVLAGVIENGK
jgi:hypothetical protein